MGASRRWESAGRSGCLGAFAVFWSHGANDGAGEPGVTPMENPLTPLRFLQRAASVHPDRTAIIDGTRTFTYAAMAAEVNRLANALLARGLQKGDRVAYLRPELAPRC